MKTLFLWILQIPMIIVRTAFVLVMSVLTLIPWLFWGRTFKRDHWMTLTWSNYDLFDNVTTVTYQWPTRWHFILWGFNPFYRKETHQ